jgi:hypothetical protein
MHESHGRVQGDRDTALRVRAEWLVVMTKSVREDGDDFCKWVTDNAKPIPNADPKRWGYHRDQVSMECGDYALQCTCLFTGIGTRPRWSAIIMYYNTRAPSLQWSLIHHCIT